MTDFLEYVFRRVKSRQLAESEAVNLIRQFEIWGASGSVVGNGVIQLPEQLPVSDTLYRTLAQELPAQIPLPVIEEASAELRDLLAGLLLSRLQALGVFDNRIDTDPRSKVIPLYHRWLEASLNFLARFGLIQRREDTAYTLSRPVDEAALWECWNDLKRNFPANHSLKATACLIDISLREMPSILTGKQPATDILFSDDSLDGVAELYRGHPVADYFNTALSAALIAIIDARLQENPDYRFNILEIGAGTGGTSAVVFNHLKPWRQRIKAYYYTDLSKAFLLHAESAFKAEAPYLRTEYFNVEKPILEQKIGLGEFDIAIAANVLHATPDIRRALRNAKAAVKHGGFLLLNEISRNSFFGHLAFGLIEGWWRYRDNDLRIDGCPGLYPARWETVLKEEGFDPVIIPLEAAHKFGQQLIVAQSDGIIRQESLFETASDEKRPLRAAGNFTEQTTEIPVQEIIIDKISDALKIPVQEVEFDHPFMEYGVDSIIGVRVIRSINRALQIDLTTTSLFSYPTVTKLAAYIVSEYGAGIVSQSRQTGEGAAVVEQNATAASVKEPIAVVGMSGRFARSETLNELWEHLAAGRELVEDVRRWDLAQLDPAFAVRKKGYCARGGFIPDIGRFDPLFFNISGMEATYMDPQQRLFLEEAWKALEDAGYAGQSVEGQKVGVYVGCAGSDYTQLFQTSPAVKPPAQAYWGNAISILPARIAYYLDLQGPAIAVDTACSSSLVAMHLACQALRQGEIGLALAGGVTLQSTPAYFLLAGRAGMLSASGHCYAFDARADGMVPGEGVGAVVLKRLSEAQVHGDHIYGVIRGSGINQDGASNGITAPSALAQERLLRQVYETFAVSPQRIQFVEAHGTGTELGDPIEYQALTNAFRKDTDKTGFCALGSIKTNLGHTAAAAGVAGVIKILLSLRHRKIPASLHFQSGNPAIEFTDSPFYVNTCLKDWEAEAGQKRCAAVSAFGFSGTNAHVVIEEAPAGSRRHSERPGYLVVLSARTGEQLRQQAQRLGDYCAANTDPDVGNISLTLLLGRKTFEHRLALAVRNCEELIEGLREWCERGQALRAYSAQVKERDRREQASLKRYGQQCIQACRQGLPSAEYLENLATLADLYCQGYALDYSDLFKEADDTLGYSRLSLPTYPFAAGRYWISPPEETGPSHGLNPKSTDRHLHPLLHENLSGAGGLKFGSDLPGAAFFLNDHRVNGAPVLPGVAHLELARAAIEQAMLTGVNRNRKIKLKNVVWARPAAVLNNSLRLAIALLPQTDTEIHYKIYRPEADAENELVYSQGVVELIPPGETSAVVDLHSLQRQCGQKSLNRTEVYQRLKAVGIEHGPGFQGLEILHLGVDAQRRPQVLAKLKLPAAVCDGEDAFFLHPSLLDSALQASIALSPGTAGPEAPHPLLPFALETLEISGPCSPRRDETLYAWVRYSEGSHPGQPMEKLDIDICDNNGKISVSFKGFAAKKPEAVNRLYTREPAVSSLTGTLILTPVWDTVASGGGRTDDIQLPLTERSIVFGLEVEQRALIQRHFPVANTLDIAPEASVDTLAEKLSDIDAIDHLVCFFPNQSFAAGGIPDAADETLIRDQNRGVLFCFRMIKALLALGCGARSLAWTVITEQTQSVFPGDKVIATHAGVHGLMDVLAKEYPGWKVRLIDVPAQADLPLAEVFSLPFDTCGNAWAYRRGQWYRQRLCLCDVSVPPAAEQTVYRKSGVYVVIGGAGGIGTAWSEHILRRCQARIIWLGRRAADRDIQAKLERLPGVEYMQADAGSRADLEQAYQRIKAHYGLINGVVHSAIALLDQSLANMEEARFRAGLAAKVDISVRLAQVFAKESLDFVLFFSSWQSFTRSPGQSNYAAGCMFKDAFATQLAQCRPCAVKVMNWGYWGNIGIVAADTYKKRMAAAGIGSIDAAEAMAALDILLSGPHHQLAMIKTTRPLQNPLAGSEKDSNGGAIDTITWLPRQAAVSAGLEQALSTGIAERVAIPEQEITRADNQLLDRLLGQLLLSELCAMKIVGAPGAAVVVPVYQRWLHTSFDFLETLGMIRRTAPDRNRADHVSVCTLVQTVDGQQVRREWEGMKHTHPHLTILITLAEAVLRELPAILTGKRPATDILFPNGSMEMVEGLYKNNAQADYFNYLLAESMLEIIAAKLQENPHHRFRLLEIGAGTGGTSATVFNYLQPYQAQIVTYWYTDISKAFLLYAQRHFGPVAPYLQTHYFNVEKPLAEQDIPVGDFDIVIATNVLHATGNIHNTLRNAKACLKHNGFLLINEITDNNFFTHLTFGLLPGWWHYDDAALRLPGCPGLAPDTWERVLKQEGFSAVIFPARQAHARGQQIIAARSDGLVRQPPALQTGKNPAAVPAEKKRAPKAPAKNPQCASAVTDAVLMEHVTETIIRQLSLALQVPFEEIGRDGAFSDYGVDSITGVQLAQILNRELGIELETTSLFNHASVDALAGHILGEFRAVIVSGLQGRHMPESETHEAVIPVPDFAPAFPATHTPATQEPVAVIGMSGRFAESETLDQFWQHLANGDDLVKEVSRWNLAQLDPGFSDAANGWCRHGSFLTGVDQFDPQFFNISTLEADYMDPQQRLFLEECWKTLEDAAYTGGGIKGSRCGVYAGCIDGSYKNLLRDTAPAQAFWGNSLSILAARIAYFLDLQGPAVAIDTACSSSLVAIHMACQALRNREIDMALAGGIALLLTPDFYLMAGRAGMLSPAGRCRTFDRQADGFVPGEGVGVVLLKRLADAFADGDHIEGIIRGSGINQDGATNGITAPSATSQERLQRQVYAAFDINPESIQMVEAHGTATALGDPIEVQALTASFTSHTQKRNCCALGSVKSNIGHTLTAAGVAGVLKILLALKHKQLPPTLHFDSLNTHIQLDGTPFYVNTQLRSWEVPPGMPRRACISSFGFSGTNAHMVIEEAPPNDKEHRPAPLSGYLVVLSARSEEQLKLAAQQLIEHCQSADAPELGDISFTLLLGRKFFEHRLAAVARDQDELIRRLKKWCKRGQASRVFSAHIREKYRREQISLKEYGNQCIDDCLRNQAQHGYLDRDYLDRLAAIAELFVQGYQLNYEALFAAAQNGAARYRRVSLPTYPFAKSSYWIGEHPLQSAAPSTANATSIRLLYPAWQAAELRGISEAAYAHTNGHWILLLEGFTEEHENSITRALPAAHCRRLDYSGQPLSVRYTRYAAEIFIILQNILRASPVTSVLVQLVIARCAHKSSRCLAGLIGLLKTANRENPKLITQYVQLEFHVAADSLPDLLRRNAGDTAAREIRYRKGVRETACLRQLNVDKQPPVPWCEKGVYLITGGAGGLGLIFANAIAASCKPVTLILTGRRQPDANLRAQLNRLTDKGAKAEYAAVDVADQAALQGLVDRVQVAHGPLTGVLHCAGVIHDNYLINKTEEEFSRVLAAKVSGAVNIDRVTRRQPLKCFIFFSSLASGFGSAGQGDYAAANGFLDHFAHYREKRVRRGKRRGATLSINWPLWAQGGMQASEDVRKQLAADGLVPLGEEAGLYACCAALASRAQQVLVLAGDARRLAAVAQTPPREKAQEQNSPAGKINEAENTQALREKTLQQLKKIFAEVSHTPLEQIDGDEPLESYGIDSILIARLNRYLENVFADIPKTLFFEFGELAALANYLLEAYPEECRSWIGMPEQTAAVQTLRSTFDQQPLPENSTPAETDTGIAIIGIHGRYPQADTLEDFWENLKTGKNCLSEIPQSRWRLEEFYHPDPQQAVARGRSYCKWGGFIDGFADFDPLFFNIAPLEAVTIDPQERLFLQSCWHLLEDAGYTRESLAAQTAGRVGVFAGITKTGFELYGSAFRQQGLAVYPHTSFSSVANRVSWLFNFRGPSMPVDTMCSASLTAVHEACEHIKRGECDLAIAGGVNLYLHPSSYVSMCATRILSTDGLCKSFGAGGDGFVPGEGVGTVLLKPRARARADRDRILAVILATSVNHGGKTNGYTVPSPDAQADLVRAALNKARVHPRTISYIEAHGTGTALGDPIEIRGLTKAFTGPAPGDDKIQPGGTLLGSETQYCSIGSAKSNLGHLEAAAGIAGLSKIILQMQHRQLAPSLHSQQLNPDIPFVKTPFKVQQTLEEWQPPQLERDGRVIDCPRRAGISSFGAGGANAHLILEEYLPVEGSGINREQPALILLSAKTEPQLQAQVENLLAAIEANGFTDKDLPDIAYTLQIGREAMAERLALIADSIASMVDKLTAFLTAESSVDGFCRGRADKNKNEKQGPGFFGVENESRPRILLRTAALWVKGAVFDWQGLYAGREPRRIRLPGYPFARETHWITAPASQSLASVLHPLLHRNISDAEGLKFTSELSNQAFFLNDHRVKGLPVLPGVAHLEMAAAAFAQIMPRPAGAAAGLRFFDVVWASPLVVEGSWAQVKVALHPGTNGVVSYEIFRAVDTEKEKHLYSQGKIRADSKETLSAIDLDDLRRQCRQKKLSAEQVYELFAATEISYGPAHRGIENLCIGVDKNNRPQALAKLALPVAVADSRDQYLLHPSVLDAALQAGIGLFIGTAGAGGESLPFALESMQVAGPCPAAGYAWVRCSPGSDPGDAMPRFDIHLCDEQGRVCITFTGFSVRLLHRRPADPVPRSQPAHSTDSDEFPDSVRATLREKTIALITAKVAATLRMAPQQLDAATPLEQYGVDSILVVRLANALSGELERVTSPLFFEHQTIGALADHFIATQAQTLRALFELSGQTGASVEAIHSAPAAPATSFIRASVAAESIVSGVDIAIIGLSGRYPQAPTLDIFWKNLKEGKNCITEIPPLRWDWREYFTEEKGQPEKIYSKWGGFIEDADKFDALFFNISPKEAEYTDPQERVFLETAYHVIEDAGYTPGNMSGSRSVGVFVGVMNSTYRRQTHFWSIANRVSYLFNFQGPSLAVDTACSSSLTAIHLALESLHSGGCECAIAGGVNLILSPLHYQGLSAASMLTAGEQCKSFGAGADGFVDGEGVGAVLLKPLARAEANGDHIYALVKGSSINAGGRTQGYTVPNPGAQRAVVIDALRRSATDPRAISYIEAHGTGTALGDPIEISALTDAFNTRLDASLPEPDAQYCAIGSAKSNIGHLESAAGIAGVTKVLLQFKHRQLAPSLHARNLNPAIDFAQTPFKVQQDLAQWQPSVLSGDGREQAFPRIAGVSSFGAGGANAHVILQEYIAAETAQHEAEAKSVLIVLSAKTEAQLKQLAKNLHAEIAEHYAAAEPQQKHALLKRIAFTLQVGREAMQERLGMVVASLESLQEKLSGFIRDNPPGDGAYRGSTRKGSDALAVFNDAEELQQAIASWVNSGRQGKLLALWVNGLVFDWRRLYGNDTPTRISLPLYPFARKSHWIATGHEKSVANANVMSLIDADENQAGSVSTFAGTMALAPVWEITKPAPHQALHAQTVLVSATEAELAYLREQYPDIRSLTLQADDSLESIKEKFEPHAGMDHLIWILPVPEAQSEIIAAQESGVILCFKAIKALLLLGYANRSLAWTVITRQTLAVTPADHTFAAHASVHGLMGSLAKEYSGWSVRVVDLEAGVERGPLLLALSLPFDAHGNLWAQRGGQWYRQQLLPCEFSDAAQRLGGRSGGVYVVIGGAGGIGEVWSEYMIRTYGAQLIWLGRRQQDDNIQARLERMAALGTVPLYIRADAADRAALQQAYTEIKSRFGAIHGLVHAAIVLQDRSLGNMDEARFRTSLAAKVNTSAHMAEVFAEETLDFVLFFSSLQSFSKAAGQSNYSAGCTFTDAFAWQLAQAWPCPVKIINWGYWGSVGVVSSDHYRKRMAAAGIGSIEPPEAMTALEQLLCGPLAQMALLKTTRPSALESAFGLQGLLLEDQFTCLPEPVQRYSDLQSARLCDSCARVPLPSVQSNREDEEALQNVLGRLLISQLQAVAVCDAQGECNEKIPSEILPLYRRWLETSFAFLARLGLFIPEPDKHYTGRLSGRVDRETAWSDWERQKERHPTLTALLKLVDSTLRELPAILTGRRPATDILFPNASMAAVEDIYKNNAPADYFNEVVAAALVAIMEERWRRDPHYRFRLLEIGAGTGGTSATVFKRLEPLRERIETYCYTDISKAFFLHAEEQFGLRVPYLKTHYFNVEKPPTEQGLTVGSFDIAIATNVLHATKNIHNTLRNAKACLKGNGFLLINELTDNSLFGHLTFALLEGWWLYEDAALRIPGCPCLYPDTWERALQQEGLSPVIFPVGKAHPLGQQVIVAQSDGLIRQGGARRGDLPFLREKVKAADAEATQQPQPDTPVMDHSIAAHVSGTIVEQLSQSLKIPREEIDTAQPFRDYGVDSITGVQLVRQINRSLGTGLETTVLYSYSTVEKLADHILAEYRPVIAAPDAVRPPQPHSVKTLAAETAAPAAVIPEPIAVIGMSCRFAQSENPDQLWRHLANGDDLIEAVTRWDLGRLDPGFAGRDKGYCRHGSFIADIDQFDALFFNISGLEATHMDPQQRLFLEECWKAIEDAGYAGTIEGSRCGVFAGCAGSEYAQLVRAHYAAADTAEPAPPAQAFWGNAAPVLPARIAYFLDLQGPAIAIDTACSSSLVAIHMACQHLWGREIDTALAGGIMLQTTPAFYLSAGRAGMLSASGRCRSFDARADGFVPGEGAGVVMLKRLCAALADGDHLYGVIRGSGTNQDGASNGITAPSALSQARLMRRIYQTFAIQPQQIQMLEAHGTATELGDPIEYQALVKAFASGAEKTTYCALGSIKSNLGHTLLAAGVAGVIKILLALKHKKIPATLHYQSSNPAIDLNGSPFYINTRLRDWAVAPGQKRCAAVSAFGFSGTNAHLVIEEAPATNRCHTQRRGYLFVLSALEEPVLRLQVQQLLAFCETHSELDPGNLSFTLLTGRKPFEYRLATVAQDLRGLIKNLRRWYEQGRCAQVYSGRIQARDRRGQTALGQYAEQCIAQCAREPATGDYADRLATLADLFVQGYPLDYKALFADGYSRLSLPGYPFARERYWIEPNKEPDSRTHFLTPVWEPLSAETMKQLEQNLAQNTFIPATTARVVVMGGSEQSRQALRQLYLAAQWLDLQSGAAVDDLVRQLRQAPDHIIWIPPAAPATVETLPQACEQNLIFAFRLLKALLALGCGERRFGWTIVTSLAQAVEPRAPLNPAQAGLHGLAGSMAKEYPHWNVQVIDLASESEWPLPESFALPADGQGNARAYRGGRWHRQELAPCDFSARDTAQKQGPYKSGGVYVVIGGAGGIGEVWSESVIERFKAQIVWIGRRAQDDAIEAKINRLARLGPAPYYIAADAGDPGALHRARDEILQKFSRIDGVIHSAVGTLDKSLAEMDERHFRAVLKPKVDASLCVARVFLPEYQQRPESGAPDFIVFFSSLASFAKEHGKSGYAAGSVFEDALALYLARECGSAVKVMNWGWWGSVGVAAEVPAVLRNRLQNAGIGAIKAQEAMTALALLLEGPLDQLGLINTLRGHPLADEPVVREIRPDAPGEPVQEKSFEQADAVVGHGRLREKAEHFFKRLIADTLKLPLQRVDCARPLEAYGIDSILIGRITRALSQTLRDVDSTLLFEHHSIDALIDHFMKTQPDALMRLVGWEMQTATAAIPVSPRTEVRKSSENAMPAADGKTPQPRVVGGGESIAVIGMSGRYPRAVNLDEYWENLRTGKDCITEIPAGRWPLEDFFLQDFPRSRGARQKL